MLHIMIVDDEPNIVEGLCHLIQALDTDNLNVIKAYSGREALALIGESPVDLVLSDIRMPGMSGLQMLSALEEYWPCCRIVFLTGYSEFEYIHTAIKSPQCAGYLLKTEGDDEIVAVVRRELEGIGRQKEHSTLLARTREQMTTMMSLLRERYLHALVTEGPQPDDPAAFGTADLGLHIDPAGPVLAAVGLLHPAMKLGNMERARLALAAGEAMADAYGSRVVRDFALMEDGLAVWLMQAAERPGGLEAGAGESFVEYVGAGMQLVQDSIRLIGSSISFALASEMVSPERLPEKVRALEALALRMGAADSEMIIQERRVELLMPPESRGREALRLQFPALLRKLEQVLTEGSAADFRLAFQSLLGMPGGGYTSVDALSQTMLLSMLLAAAGRLNLSGELASRIRLEELFPAGEEDDASLERYLKLGLEICRLRAILRKNVEEQSIERVKQYVVEHISDKNLSLSRIAAFTFYNPSYLSRFFKQQTGLNLSEYINEVRLNQALQLLKNREVRINEITNRIGFESPSYFTMFFKRRMGVTPNEYRASLPS